MTCGCPGIYFLNTAKRAMDLMNIGIYVLTLKSNVQVGDEFLMGEVIGNASSIKSAREYVQEYDTELPLAISVLDRHLGHNVDFSASTSTYEPAVITKDTARSEERRVLRVAARRTRLDRKSVVYFV